MAASEHLVDGDLVRLPGEIPEGHLHAADAATLPTVESKLFDSLEKAFDVAGVLTKKTALEHESVARTASVPDLAKTTDALVRVDPNYRHPHGSALDVGDTQISDSEARGFGVSIDSL